MDRVGCLGFVSKCIYANTLGTAALASISLASFIYHHLMECLSSFLGLDLEKPFEMPFKIANDLASALGTTHAFEKNEIQKRFDGFFFRHLQTLIRFLCFNCHVNELAGKGSSADHQHTSPKNEKKNIYI